MTIRISNLSFLGNLIKKNLPNNFIEVIGEVNQPSKNKNHLYFTLKDQFGSIPSIIWNFNDTLSEGNKIKIIGRLDYYTPYGKLSLHVKSFKIIENKGELHNKYISLKEKYHKLGYFDKNNKMSLPLFLKNILVLTSTSNSSAAIKDFKYGIEKHNNNLNIDYQNVAVQGYNCPKDIIQFLNEKKKQLYDSYDLIVITRGGGSFEDLFGFCDEDLIQCIHEFKAPVLSAIGHEKDTTLLDLVADIISPTPSFAAEFITSHNLNYVTNQKSIIHKIQQKLNDSIYENINILNRYKNVIINQKNILDQFVNNFYINIQDEINQNMLYLEKVKSKFKVDNDINIFDLSYNNIKTQTDFTDKVKNNEPFILCWKDTVIKINSYNLING